MISICIPVYNFEASQLAHDVLEQCNDSYELIIIDDASQEQFRKTLRKIKHPQLRYVELEKNIGRAKIRNLFLNYAKNDYLLFLDGDSVLVSNQFLEKYNAVLNENTLVVNGGRLYPSVLPSLKQSLRWNYGVQFESKSAKERQKTPNSSFMTNNFLIHKSLLKKLPFDERILQYGHEDTLYGIELEKNEIEILHIENPILNGDVEENNVFIDKTQQALMSLRDVYSFYNDKERLIQHVNLLQVVKKLQTFRLKGIVKFLFKVSESRLLAHLMHAKKPSMKIFAFYKLGYYLNL